MLRQVVIVLLLYDWRIYYDDGSTFDSSQGEPHEAPSHGFICAIGYDQDESRYIQSGWDHYRWDKETHSWWGTDLLGVFDRLRFNKEIYAYKEGRTVSKIAFQEIMDKAHRDKDFPQ
jgi:hypothetical protein